MSDNESNEENNSKNVKKNFFIITIRALLLATSLNAVSNLQSSINIDKNLGLYSLVIISGTAVLACFLFTDVIIYLIGYKWTNALSHIGYIAYSASNIYPKAWLLLPGSAVCGICRAWSGISATVYIAHLSKCKDNNGSNSRVTLYFGIFYCLSQSSQIWGNLITFVILRYGNNNYVQNNTDQCGANFLESEHASSTTNHHQISMTTAAILFGIFTGINILSLILVIVFLDQKEHMQKSKSKGVFHESWKYLLSTLKQMKNYKQILLLPLSFWTGVSSGFVTSVFTKSFITCSVGIRYVGLLMIVFGIAASLSAIVVSFSGKYRSQSLFLYIGYLLSYAALITMLLWKPTTSQMYVLYILSVLTGIADSIWYPISSSEYISVNILVLLLFEILAIYENLFSKEKEAAYSVMFCAQHLGYLMIYVYAGLIRSRISIILQLIYLTVTVITYSILAIRNYYEESKQSNVMLIKINVKDG